MEWWRTFSPETRWPAQKLQRWVQPRLVRRLVAGRFRNRISQRLGFREMFQVEQVVGGRPQAVNVLHRRAGRRAHQRSVAAKNNTVDGRRDAVVRQFQHGQLAFADDRRIHGRIIGQQFFRENGRMRPAGHHQRLRTQQRFCVLSHHRPFRHTGGDE